MGLGALSLGVTLLLAGCASPVDPADLRVPARLSCIYLPTPVMSTRIAGLLSIVWETRLERGPYVSEREDETGTFYRAPSGGVLIRNPDMAHRPAGMYSWMTYDGGLWVPRDPAQLPRVYTYFSTAPAPTRVPAQDFDCTSVGYVRDPSGQGVRVVEFMAAGAVGGAVAGAGVGAAGTGFGKGYGASIGVGAVGGAIGGAIVAGLINMDVGKIVTQPALVDEPAIVKIRQAAQAPVPVLDVGESAGAARH